MRMEERPQIWRVAANKLYKQSQKADKGWSYILVFGRGANKSTPLKIKFYERLIGEILPLETKQSGGKILHHTEFGGGESF